MRDSSPGDPESRESDDIFRSDIVDLGELDLTTVHDLPNPVLRAAVERFCAELGSGAEPTAFFQNTLPGGGVPSRAPDGHHE